MLTVGWRILTKSYLALLKCPAWSPEAVNPTQAVPHQRADRPGLLKPCTPL